MTERIDLPESLMGTHIESPVDIRMAVQEILEHHLPAISPHRDESLELENMPSILVAEDSANAEIRVYVPLPYLHHADLETDQLQDALAPTMPAATRFRVEVHPGSDYDGVPDDDAASNPLEKYHT